MQTNQVTVHYMITQRGLWKCGGPYEEDAWEEEAEAGPTSFDLLATFVVTEDGVVNTL